MPIFDEFSAFLAANPRAVQVTIGSVKGSAPRERDAVMLVGPDGIAGTIGGGQLEFMAIARARAMLESGEAGTVLDVPLGPEIGQCCGGRVEVALTPVDAALARDILDTARMLDAARPQVFVFGAGHVGKALYAQFRLLPVEAILADTRAEAVAPFSGDANVRHVAMPEVLIEQARPGSAFVVMTHDHGLDFLLTSAALQRADAAYAGMIGSKTKRASFASRFLEEGGTQVGLERLVCPIGASSLDDKRPEVIAAMTAAEILRAVLG
ncbi:MAG: xanthine dehydrogenase accessory protein XdhC [Brucellaceae bacterium]|nr:xanthine dehydrogenase accessory protein XdhC [Brucellaceae bacterium]